MKLISFIFFIILTYTFLFAQEVINLPENQNKEVGISVQPVKDESDSSTSTDTTTELSTSLQPDQSVSNNAQIEEPINKRNPETNNQETEKTETQSGKDYSKNLTSESSQSADKDKKQIPQQEQTIPSSIINADIPQLSPPTPINEEDKTKSNSLLTKIFDDKIPLIPKEKVQSESPKQLVTAKGIKKPQEEVMEELNYYPKQKENLLKDYQLEGFLNINTATIDQFLMLPMIDYRRALAIIDHRKQNGEFKNLIDIEEVLGIDSIIFNKIYPYITLSGENTLKYVKIKK